MSVPKWMQCQVHAFCRGKSEAVLHIWAPGQYPVRSGFIACCAIQVLNKVGIPWPLGRNDITISDASLTYIPKVRGSSMQDNTQLGHVADI